jgi:predicted Zn-dependent protease with MMP-like domain
VIDVPPDRFEELVGDALDSIPEELARYMDNVVVVVEEGREDGTVLGHYLGVPLTARDPAYGTGGLVMPDRITVYRRPLCASVDDEEGLVEQVRITVVHEVAHHFGIDDHRLDELGWG